MDNSLNNNLFEKEVDILIALEILYHPVYLLVFCDPFIENEHEYDVRTVLDNFQNSLTFFFFKNFSYYEKEFLRKKLWILIELEILYIFLSSSAFMC
jgi:hypothetical protein